MIFFGQRSLDRAIREFVDHQGLDNRLLEQCDLPATGDVVRDERLGGLLSFYRRAARARLRSDTRIKTRERPTTERRSAE